MLRENFSKKQACRNVYGEVLAELGAHYPAIVALDADLSKSTKTAVFAQKFPDRFFQCGVAESNMMGVAAGLAHTGKIPFVSTFAIFATGRAWEMVRQSIAYNNVPVRIVATHAGISVGPDGASHQALEDIAVMSAIPNMQIISPADCLETKQALEASMHIEGPLYIRLGRSAIPIIFSEKYQFKFGQAQVLLAGSAISIFATGGMVSVAVEAARALYQEKIAVEVVNVSTLKPLDRKTILHSARKTKRVITIEEHSVIGGLGDRVSNLIAEEGLAIPVKKIGLEDVFGESGEEQELLQKYGLTPERLKQDIYTMVSSPARKPC